MDSPILKGWKDIANFLGVHPDTAEKMCEEEGLPVVKIGGGVFASKNAIHKWIIKYSTLDFRF